MTLPVRTETIKGVHFRLRPDQAVREAWPIVACTALMPLMFLLGLHGLIWAAPGIVLTWRG